MFGAVGQMMVGRLALARACNRLSRVASRRTVQSIGEAHRYAAMAAPIRITDAELLEVIHLRDVERWPWARIASKTKRNEGWLNKKYDAYKADLWLRSLAA